MYTGADKAQSGTTSSHICVYMWVDIQTQQSWQIYKNINGNGNACHQFYSSNYPFNIHSNISQIYTYVLYNILSLISIGNISNKYIVKCQTNGINVDSGILEAQRRKRKFTESWLCFAIWADWQHRSCIEALLSSPMPMCFLSTFTGRKTDRTDEVWEDLRKRQIIS